MSILQDRFSIKSAGLIATTFSLWPNAVLAHASEQGFVLLLPTKAYTVAGVLCVVLTVLLLAALPGGAAARILRPAVLIRRRRLSGLRHTTSCLAMVAFAALIWVGYSGPRDPLANPLPLFIWTLWWIGFVVVQGLVGDLWRWVNPWTGPVALARSTLNLRPFLRLPVRLGHSPAIVTFLGFAGLLLADPAPADPARLAYYCAAYWVVTFAALLAFGPRWLHRGEGLTVLLRNYARVGLLGPVGRRLGIGLWGWQVLVRRAPAPGLAVFMLIMLGSGSFDGLNETFWWLDLLGINPLEFPGRSAVIAQNLAGLVIANTALILAYALAVWMGVALAGAHMHPIRAFCLFAPSILPIALGYHIAHYLTSFLVDWQYALAAASDPFATSANLFGLEQFYVTTGFFNSQDSVRTIWLTQAGAVVAGHVLAVMLAHAIAVRAFGSSRRAALSQAPLAVFMVLYTFFGLWLLASPRGV